MFTTTLQHSDRLLITGKASMESERQVISNFKIKQKLLLLLLLVTIAVQGGIFTNESTIRNPASIVIMVAHEWIEGAQLHPSNTQFLCCVVLKATDVSTNHWNSIELILQNSCKSTPYLSCVCRPRYWMSM